MSIVDPIGDMITRIRNAGKSKLISFEVSYSKLKKDVLDVLVSEGYISNYSSSSKGSYAALEVFLKYSSDGEFAIVEIDRVSKPGKRMYSSILDLKPYYNGMGTYVISTSHGVISDDKARTLGVGGELICKVF